MTRAGAPEHRGACLFCFALELGALGSVFLAGGPGSVREPGSWGRRFFALDTLHVENPELAGRPTPSVPQPVLPRRADISRKGKIRKMRMNRQLGEPLAAVRQPPTESEKRNRGANGPPKW